VAIGVAGLAAARLAAGEAEGRAREPPEAAGGGLAAGWAVAASEA